MRPQRTIVVCHRGVGSALGVDQHFQLSRCCVKQPTGFDYLEALVHQGGGVYRNFPAHVPVRVFTGLGRRHLAELFRRHVQERTAGCREDYSRNTGLFQVLFKTCGQGLENSILLGVDRQNPGPITVPRFGKEFTCSAQGCFVGQQYFFSAFCLPERRLHPARPARGPGGGPRPGTRRRVRGSRPRRKDGATSRRP